MIINKDWMVIKKCDNKQTKFTFILYPSRDLEHTELLTNVGETLGLLRFVVNDVESDSLGKRSMY